MVKVSSVRSRERSAHSFMCPVCSLALAHEREERSSEGIQEL